MAAAPGATASDIGDRRRVDPPNPQPCCTYRLQIHRDFTLVQAAELIDYLADLGVDHVYTAPLLQAAAGSSHGYDWTAADQIDGARGGADGYRRFCDALERRGLRHVIDIVPNHMSTATPDNRWWWDVLRHGRASRFARYYDIDWESSGTGCDAQIVLPILAESLEEALERSDLHVERGIEGCTLHYFDHVLPLEGVPEAMEVSEIRGQRLRALLDAQAYRLVHWRDGESELNYRRFFEVDALVGLRVEDAEVFDASHEWLLRAVREGKVGGLRIDHPDGLRNPAGYLRRLASAAGGIWTVVEKILEGDESLRRSWPVDGTTGYDFANLVGGLFIDPSAKDRFERIYSDFAEDRRGWHELAVAKRRQVLLAPFRAERARLQRCLDAAVPQCDAVTREQLHDALDEVLVRFPVYRTYIEPDTENVDGDDAAAVEAAATAARTARPDLSAAVDVLAGLVLLRGEQGGELQADFVARFQQTTGPLMAKGVEDTAFYCHARFVALNEVGGDPSRFGVLPQTFHDDCRRRQRDWPASMLATSTHDTKRSEDVRARLFLLSEIPDLWETAVKRWRVHNQRHRSANLPDRRFEYFFYQTLVGAHPLPPARALPYFEKVVRETKEFTSWRTPDPRYEDAIRRFIEAALGDRAFLADLDAFVAPLIEPARTNALAQTLLKLTAPGVPDLYQGTELWDSSLVDPDNRRPVDYALRRRLLARLQEQPEPEEILADNDLGLSKLWLISRALDLRRRRPDLFGAQAEYRPLYAGGQRGDRVVALARGSGGSAGVIAIAPRLTFGMQGWADTTLELPAGSWQNLLTGERGLRGTVAIADVFLRFRVALLENERDA